jgi:glucosamine--fructose-6-phosphate aminotransferase (isomerizing)
MSLIVGAISASDAAKVVLTLMSVVERHKCDHGGFAFIGYSGGKARIAKGSVSNLCKTSEIYAVSGGAAIGHACRTVHATGLHRNIQPYRAGQVTLVFDGILTNCPVSGRGYDDISMKGSGSDPETIAELINAEVKYGATPLQAIRQVHAKLKGNYALAAMFDDAPGMIFLARNGYPLAIGYGAEDRDGCSDMFISSDASAVSTLARHIAYLEDKDVAIVSRVGTLIFDGEGRDVDRRTEPVSISGRSTGQGRHFSDMLRDIHEQPAVLGRLAEAWRAYATLKPLLHDIPSRESVWIDRVLLIACGYSYNACLTARHWFENWAGVQADVELASEYRYREPILSGRELAVFVSRTEESAEILATLGQIRQRVASCISLVNSPTSSLAQECGVFFPLLAGPESGANPVKTFTAQMFSLAALSINLGRDRNRLSAERYAELSAELMSLPRKVKQTLQCEPDIYRHAEAIPHQSRILMVGRGICYPMALEAAQTFRDVGYVYAEGFAAGELGGRITTDSRKNAACIVMAPSGPLFDKALSSYLELEGLSRQTLLLSDKRLENNPDALRLPRVPELLSCFTNRVALQLLACHGAQVASRNARSRSRRTRPVVGN